MARQSLIRGQSVVELLLAMGLAAIILPALITGLVTAREGRPQQTQRLTSTYLYREAVEAVRSVREKGWTVLPPNGIYHPETSGSSWSLIPGSETIDGYTRSVNISDVYRDSAGVITISGGTLDPSTKRLTVSVSWLTPRSSVISSDLYLTRYLDNLSFTHTTVADFNGGILNGTSVTNTAGGEVTLGSGAQADWCRPQDSIRDLLTLPKQGNSIYAKPTYVYIGSGDGTQGVTFMNIGITNPPQPTPPEANINGTYESTYKTNAVFNEGNYVYLATDNGSEQVVILDIGVSPYVKIGTVTIAGGAPANGIYVLGNILFVTSGSKLYTYDITVKTGAHITPLASRAMWFSWGSQPTARQVVAVGNYAYVGTGNTLFGLQKFGISNGGRTISFVGASNLTWNQQSQGLAVNSSGSRAYVAFNQGAGIFSKGFFIVDTSANPPWWWPFLSVVGSYSAGETDPRGMALGTGNKAVIVGIGGTYQYQVIDITNDRPVYCGGLAVTNGVYGVSSVLEDDGDAYSYIVSGETRDQFKIIQGGSGGRYASTGTFDSAIYSSGYSTAFNSFSASIDQPSQTTISMQTAVASAVGGTCNGATFSFVGPDSTSNSYYLPVAASVSGTIPFGNIGTTYQNPAQCFRYRVYFTTTDINQTPVFYDITTNYSP